MLHVCMTSDFFWKKQMSGVMKYGIWFGFVRMFLLDSDQKSWANPAVSSVRLEWWLGECNTLCHDGKSKKSRWKIADITWYSCKTQGFYDCTDFIWSACWILSCNKAIWTSSLWWRKLWRKSSLSIWVGKIATWSVWKGKCSIWLYRNRQCIC